MKLYLSIFTLCLVLLTTLQAYGEKADPAFIKEHLLKTRYDLDTDASAIVLDEATRVEVCRVWEQFQMYSIRLHMHRVIKLLKKDAFSLADEGFHYYTLSNYYVRNTEGTVYNLGKSGQVISTELSKDDFIRKKVWGNEYSMRFTFPNIQEGSIIEYAYDKEYPFWGFVPEWYISGDFPKLQSSYLLDAPYQIGYTALTRLPCEVTNVKSDKEALSITSGMAHTTFRIITDVEKTHCLWVRKNVPANITEPFVQNKANYREYMSLQPDAVLFGNKLIPIKNTWPDFDKDVMKSTKDGADLHANNYFFRSVADPIVHTYPDMSDRAKAIFSYVRANFSCTGTESSADKLNLKQIYQDQAGSVKEINLMLCAMLIYAKVPASPVYLSTTGNISATSLFPARDRFNYVAVLVTLGNESVLLDASSPTNPFGMLAPKCYNGYARIVDKKEGKGINLTSNLIKNKRVVAVKITDLTDSSGNFDITYKPGIISSASLRQSWKDDPSERKNYINQRIHSLPGNFNVAKWEIVNEELPDTAMIINLMGSFSLDPSASDIILPSQFLSGTEKNPFISTTRKLPIEFPYQQQFQYLMTIKLPDGWEPEDLPQPSVTTLDSNAMSAKKTYNYFDQMHTISVNNNIEINATQFERDDYASIREFYQDMIKQDHQIISIKKKH